MGSCSISNCEKPARGRYCDMHWKRHQRGLPLTAAAMLRNAQEKLSAFDRATQAGLDLANCDSEDDAEYRLKLDCFRKALERFSSERGDRELQRILEEEAERRRASARRAGLARMAALSPAERSRLGRQAIRKRWRERDRRASP